jgi:hypothetical protein
VEATIDQTQAVMGPYVLNLLGKVIAPNETLQLCTEGYIEESWYADNTDLFSAHQNYKIKINGGALIYSYDNKGFAEAASFVIPQGREIATYGDSYFGISQ